MSKMYKLKTKVAKLNRFSPASSMYINKVVIQSFGAFKLKHQVESWALPSSILVYACVVHTESCGDLCSLCILFIYS